LIETKNQAYKIIDQLLTDDPKNMERYQLAKKVIDIVYEWNLYEIEDTSVKKFDYTFIKHIDQRQTTDSVTITFPEKFKPQTPKIKLDGFADGITLVRYLLANPPEKSQKAARAMADVVITTLI